jgi:hypothetical protein
MKRTIQLSICVLALSAYACNNTKTVENDTVSAQDSLEALAIDSVTTELATATDSLEKHTTELQNEVDALLEEINK